MKIFGRLIFEILDYAEKREQQGKIPPYPKPEFTEYASNQIQHHLKECADKRWVSGGMTNEIGDYLAIGKLTMKGHRELEKLREQFTGPKSLREILIGLQNAFRDLEEAPDKLRLALNDIAGAPVRFRDQLNDAIYAFSQLPHKLQELHDQIRKFLELLDHKEGDERPPTNV